MTRKDFDNRMDEILQLEPGWDSYNALIPEKHCYEVIQKIYEYFIYAYDSNLFPRPLPDAAGGIGLPFYTEIGDYISIIIDNDKELIVSYNMITKRDYSEYFAETLLFNNNDISFNDLGHIKKLYMFKQYKLDEINIMVDDIMKIINIRKIKKNKLIAKGLHSFRKFVKK